MLIAPQGANADELHFACDRCPQRFKTQDERDRHTESVHQMLVTVTFGDQQQAVVARDSRTGLFTCPQCSFETQITSSLREHCRNNHPRQDESLKRVKRVDLAALVKLNLIWEGEHCKLICRICEEVVRVNDLVQHWQAKEEHSEMQAFNLATLAAVVHRALGPHLVAAGTSFAPPSPSSACIRALPAYRGLACTVQGCSWIGWRNFERHWKKQHACDLERNSTNSPRDATLQQWTNSSPYFEVQRPDLWRSSTASRAQSNLPLALPSKGASPAIVSGGTTGEKAAHSGIKQTADAADHASEDECTVAVIIVPNDKPSAIQASRSAAEVLPPSSASQPAPRFLPRPTATAASESSYQPSSATQHTPSRQQEQQHPSSSSVSKPPSTVPSAPRPRAPRPMPRSFFHADADKWKSASRAPKVARDGTTLNTCTWRLAEATIDEEAEVCELKFTTGEALARHLMSKHVRCAPLLRGKIMCRWANCKNRAYEPAAMQDHIQGHMAQAAYCCPFKQCRLNIQVSPSSLQEQDRHIEVHHGQVRDSELRPLLLKPPQPLASLAELARFQHVSQNAALLDQVPRHETMGCEQHGTTVRLSKQGYVAAKRTATFEASPHLQAPPSSQLDHLRTPASSRAVLAASQGDGDDESEPEEEVRPSWSTVIDALKVREERMRRLPLAPVARRPSIVNGSSRQSQSCPGIPSSSRAGSSSALPSKATRSAAPGTPPKLTRKSVHPLSSDSDSDSEVETMKRTLYALRRSHRKGASAQYDALLEKLKQRKPERAATIVASWSGRKRRAPIVQSSDSEHADVNNKSANVRAGTSKAQQAASRDSSTSRSPPNQLVAYVELPPPNGQAKPASAPPRESEPEPVLSAAALMDPRRWLAALRAPPAPLSTEGALQPAAALGTPPLGQASDVRQSLRSHKDIDAHSPPKPRKRKFGASVPSGTGGEQSPSNIYAPIKGRFASKEYAAQGSLKSNAGSPSLPNRRAATKQSSTSAAAAPAEGERRRRISPEAGADEDAPIFSAASLARKRGRSTASATPQKRARYIVASSGEDE